MDRSSSYCIGGSEQNHPKEKEMQEGRVAVSRGLTNIFKKRRSERQRRKERYTQVNSVFQRIARRDKKAFLSEQCKGAEKNNKLGKTKDLFKKIEDTKGDTR